MTADFDGQILAHITAYPGLSAFEIGRALGRGDRRTQSLTRTLYALIRLLQAGRIRVEQVDGNVRGGVKHLWYPAEAGPAQAQPS